MPKWAEEITYYIPKCRSGARYGNEHGDKWEYPIIHMADGFGVILEILCCLLSYSQAANNLCNNSIEITQYKMSANFDRADWTNEFPVETLADTSEHRIGNSIETSVGKCIEDWICTQAYCFCAATRRLQSAFAHRCGVSNQFTSDLSACALFSNVFPKPRDSTGPGKRLEIVTCEQVWCF